LCLVFANVLEQLESNFYSQALEKFNAYSFEAAGFVSAEVPVQQIQVIASDESIHAVTLESVIIALGGQVVSGCTFDFSAALIDVNTMVATARVIENVGVSAYLGALTAIADPALVTAAGSILTVEARHQTILNLLSDATSIPQPFDMALTPPDVLALAGGFISGCDLGVPANPPLTVTNYGSLTAGTKLSFSSPALTGMIPEDQLSCQMLAGGLNSSIYQPICDCVVPEDVFGPVFVFIIIEIENDRKESYTTAPYTSSQSTQVVAGPALIFIDNQPDLIGNLIRPALDNASGGGMLATAQSSMPATATMSFAAPTTVSLVPGT
ncbi:ferritin-like domain-containing protein, partial [Melanogaster broomeanus]